MSYHRLLGYEFRTWVFNRLYLCFQAFVTRFHLKLVFVGQLGALPATGATAPAAAAAAARTGAATGAHVRVRDAPGERPAEERLLLPVLLRVDQCTSRIARRYRARRYGNARRHVGGSCAEKK